MTPAVSPAPGWVTELFASIDRKDSAAFVSFLTDDGQFRFGNQAAATGREAIAAAVEGFFFIDCQSESSS